MKKFMDEDFLLTTETAKLLFNEYAKGCPIIDYHNHLSAKEIFEGRTYENLTQIWLEADHYKWRCMRANGVAEKYVTGDATDYEKFLEFAKVLPRLVGSPVYHWAHLELQRYFNIDMPLNEFTAPVIWDMTCDMLAENGFDAVSLLNKADAKILCTTDDPADSLAWHIRLAKRYEREQAGESLESEASCASASSCGSISDCSPSACSSCSGNCGGNASAPKLGFRVLPSFRPDRFMNIEQPTFKKALDDLAAIHNNGKPITDWETLKEALKKSLDFFCEAGCRVTDHGFIHFRYAVGDPAPVVEKALKGETLTEEEIAIYQGSFLRFLAGEYTKRDLVMQLHMGPIRNNSPKLVKAFGADAGGDSVGDTTDPFQLGAFLRDCEAEGELPKTILYNLNPADNTMLATMAVNFAADGAKVQYGAAWWLLDHIRGISDQIDQLMETGTLASSVGMLTDSRSFTSFVRHEYYRRILCDKIGELVEDGQYPCDIEFLGKMVEDICWKNAVNYFGFQI